MNQNFFGRSPLVTISNMILFCLGLFAHNVMADSPDVVISQVYGGGGNSGATYTHDFIELFNRGSSSVSLNGWSVQYGSTAGNLGSGITELPDVMLAPGQYYLIQEAQGSGGTTALPTPDLIDATPIAMSGTGAKVALVTQTTSLACGATATACSGGQLALIKDLVGWGAANLFETAAAPGTSNSTSVSRAADGCTDTDDNSADFTAGTVVPRNTGTALNVCGGGVETAPTVTATNPANGAGDVPLDVNISIDFSEPVNVAAGWFEISCANSGLHTATVSGGPVNFGLNPDADFADAELCTVSVFAANVSDQDALDPPDLMAADYVFSFTTLAPITNDWVINEVLADPDATAGDANGDGSVNTTQDEFVEIVNNSGLTTDISGWTLSDGVGVRHTFPAGTVLEDSCSIVVFGGGSINGLFGFSKTQTASGGSLGLNNGGDTVSLSDGVSTVATYAYGSEGGDNQSLTLDPDVTGANPLVKHSTATGSGGTLFSPGTRVNGDLFAGCPLPAEVKIHEVQGSGDTSPLNGDLVIISGIVTGDFQGADKGQQGNLQGFYVQEEDADADADPATSEGIFVFDGGNPLVDVAVGDLVEILGSVSEFNGLTEITSFTGVSVISSGNALPATTPLSLPVNNLSELEPFEGMLVVFPQALTIVEYFNFDRFGEIVLSSDRLVQPTAAVEPGSVAYTDLLDLNNRSKITLDDGRSAQNPDPAYHPNGSIFDLTNLFRGGDTLNNVTGVLDYRFSLYRIQPTQGADYTSTNPRTAEPDDVGGNVRVASFNVLNYFNGDGLGGGFPTSRGASDLDEFNRQRDKIIAAMLAIDADVFGLMEIENDGYGANSAIQDLVNGLNDATSAGTFAVLDPNVAAIGTDEIAVGLIYQPSNVMPIGDSAILDTSVDPIFLDTKNRPALAQSFQLTENDAVFTVAVNHLKSKGSDCNDVADPDLNDGAGNCNLTRAAAALALANWLDTDPTDSGDEDVIIIGDLNSYDKEDPIDVLSDAGYTDLAFIFGGEFAYSYVFDGQIGYLDYALASENLLGQVTGTTEWHINADEPDLIDYDTSFKQPAQDAIYAPDPYRASDHDPVVIGMELLNYELFGFKKGIKEIPKLNSEKAGKKVKIKFEVEGGDDADAVADGYPRSQEMACDVTSFGPSEEIETKKEKIKMGKSKDKYEYEWETDKAWKDTCRRLDVLLRDGTHFYAYFKFK